MKGSFCIVTHVVHKEHDGNYYGYAPYINEMNLWSKYANEVVVIAPAMKAIPGSIDSMYGNRNIRFITVPEFNIIGFFSILHLFWKLPYITVLLFGAMSRSSHIHLRCPGNMGLLGCILQMLFPRKSKTAKYAGNWDWDSKQPWSYRLQQKILRNIFLTKNMKVLVYGDWKESANIIPFFTASYSEDEIIPSFPRTLENGESIKLIFVGTLHEGKRPKLCLEVIKLLNEQGLSCEMHFYGDGIERIEMQRFIEHNQIEGIAKLHGNVDKSKLKEAYQQSHFLIFISKSEGWPKVVAESMFWGCLPITTAVSCVPEMLGNGTRGDIIEPSVDQIIERIEFYKKNPEVYSLKCNLAMHWSRTFTTERFENEIKSLLE